ncbi:MAG: ABC transporter permease [Candidatus Zixiibacteriota bacterium]|nr:MAG: ABC transporter permease [candidate division Zixibacteria bacterium]
MITHYLKSSLRTLLKSRMFTLISVLGLALGLAMGQFSLAYLVREMSFDQFHENKDHIYRVEMRYQHADTTWSSARVMAPLGPKIANDIPGISKVAVFRHIRRPTLKIEQRKYEGGHLIFASPEFFEVFTMPLKVGDAATALRDPATVLITDTVAMTYFPDRNPIGETITLSGQNEFTIIGILENIPSTTQLKCDYIASYSTLATMGEDLTAWTDNRSDLTYLLMNPGASPDLVEAQVNRLFAGNVSPDIAQRYTFKLKPLSDIYYDTYFSGNRGELLPGWEPDMIVFLGAIGLFILIQSIVNFISLSTAWGLDRMKEIGIRRTLGADRGKLIGQFLGESLILAAIAMVAAQFFFEFIRVGYNSVGLTAFEKTYELANMYGSANNIALLVLMTAVVGILAGIFPAVYLSRFKAISILKDGSSGVPSKSRLRRIVVVFQFTLAVFFITCAAGLHRQFDFITNYDMGFDRTDMMVLKFDDVNSTARDCAIAKNEILARNDVLGAARTSHWLGSRIWSSTFYTSPERNKTEVKYAKRIKADFDFLSFYGIELAEGRGFSRENPEDANHAVIINESMRNELGAAGAVGSRLYLDSAALEIIGVAKDFQGSAMDWSYNAAMMVSLNPDSTRILCVKLKPDNIKGSIAAIEDTWKRIFDDRVFTYSFLEDDIRARYGELHSLTVLFTGLSVISVVISCLGIFGLVSFTVKRKTKEIAIRKVLGASVAAIFGRLTKEFLVLIMIANAIAFPFGFLLVIASRQEYTFQASISVLTYVLGGMLAILLALITSAFQVTAAARANPVDALRNE